jgi:hypothetical protein
LVRNPREDTDAAQIFRNEILTISAIITYLVCTYIKPSTPSPLPLLFLNPKATRLHARRLRISQSPTAAGDNSGEKPPPLDLFSVPTFLP